MMHTSTGRITEINDAVLERIERIKKTGEYLKAVNYENMTPRRQKQLLSTGRVKIGRNEPCPCGGVKEDGVTRKKFKNCCLDKKYTNPLDLTPNND